MSKGSEMIAWSGCHTVIQIHINFDTCQFYLLSQSTRVFWLCPLHSDPFYDHVYYYKWSQGPFKWNSTFLHVFSSILSAFYLFWWCWGPLFCSSFNLITDPFAMEPIKDSFTLRWQRKIIKIFRHWVSSFNGFCTQLWRQWQWKKWVSWQQVVVFTLWQQRQLQKLSFSLLLPLQCKWTFSCVKINFTFSQTLSHCVNGP